MSIMKGQKDFYLPYQLLTSRDGIYFSSIVLSMWDNIHGPKVLMTWKGEGSDSAQKVGISDGKEKFEVKSCFISDKTLLTVVNFTLNDEAGRVEKLDGIETKFYCLKKYDVIASVSVFAIEVFKGKFEVFSFILILPYAEMNEFLSRHSICESKVQRLLKDYLISPLKDMAMDHSSIQSKISQVLMKFHEQLFKFTQVMLGIRKYGLLDRINVSETYLSGDSEMKGFLPQVITAHLQSSGYTVILGSNGPEIDKMIKTLAIFLSSKERKMSRLCDQVDENSLYEPDLFLQGFIFKPSDAGPNCVLPFTKGGLYCNKLPPTIVHLDTREVIFTNVFLFEQKIPRFIRKKEDQSEEHKMQKSAELLHFKDLSIFTKEHSSRVVQDFLDHINLLPTIPGVKESFTSLFLKQLKLKALAIAKYVDAEPKSVIPELASEVLALGRGTNITDRPRINQASLQQDLSIDSAGDLYVILAFAEKIRPKTYLDVLGDPQLNDLAMINEFQNF